MKRNNNKNDGFNHKIGKRIKAKKVRLIDETGANCGVVHIAEATKRAEECGLDLVEVGPGEVPVCKILDYGKLKYQASKKEKKKEKKTHEIKFRPKIAEHDLEIKIRNARKFLEDGSTVKLTVKFAGREKVHPEQGSIILEKVSKSLVDIPMMNPSIQKQPKSMTMVLIPKEN